MAEILLIGASGGIGQHLVNALSKEHRCIGTYLSSEQQALAPGAEYHTVDVTHVDAITRFADSVGPQLQQPVLIYTPGIAPPGLVHRVDEHDWDRTLAVNLTGAMRCTRAFLPRMRELGWGRVIYVSSVLARVGMAGTGAYAVTKAGLAALGRSVSVENAARGITANTLALGYFDVGIIREVPDEFLRERVLPQVPQGRLGRAENIAAAVRFLIAADYVTGATLDINGGMIGG